MTATEKPYTPSKGDQVMFKPEFARPQDTGKVFTVKQTLKVNVDIVPVGGGQTIRTRPYMLMPAPEGGAAPAATGGRPYESPLLPAQVVKFTGKPGLFVVLRDNGGKYSVAPLNASDGRYWRGVARHLLTPVTITSIETTNA